MLELRINDSPFELSAPIPEGATVELAARPPPGAALTLLLGGAALEPFLRPGDPAWRWRWVAPGAAGAYELRLRAAWPDGGADELRAQIEVVPRKLDQERYTLLLADLQRLGRALVFARSGGAAPAGLPGEVDTTAPTPAEELHGLFGAELERLAAAVERIARRPPDRLRPGGAEVGLGQVQDASRIVEVRPELELAELSAPTPTYDSYEARLLRRLLDTLWRRLARLERSGPGGGQVAGGGAARRRGPEAAWEREIAAAREQLRALRALPFLVDVPPLGDYRGPTPRFQRDPDYRVVYRIWRQLRRRPLVRWDDATLAIPVAELPRLYERWCAATVALALLELPGLTLIDQALCRDDGEEQLLALPDTAPLVTLATPAGARLTLRYQPRYTPFADRWNAPAAGRWDAPAGSDAPPGRRSPRAAASQRIGSLDRHTRVPDLALEIVAPGALPQVIVLDAKYRLDAAGGVPEDALADAYSYLGSIGILEAGRAVAAAALLYPGTVAEEHASGVAALPLLPGEDRALRAWLAARIAKA